MTAPKLPPLAERLRKVCAGPRAELEVSRHIFDGSPAYVVRDPITFQSHWFTVEDYRLFACLRADKTLSDVFQQLCADHYLSPEQEEDFYRFVVSLQESGLLNLPINDGQRLYGRYTKKREMERKGRLFKLLYCKVPLFCPDRFLARTERFVAPLFTRTALWLWLMAITFGILLVVRRWHEFRDPLGSMLALKSLPVLWTLLVGLKTCHEFGHAFACKRFGGTVPEMGAYFIMFTPCAYVDASSSWGFERRQHRIVVTLAGMYIESILAVIALVIWSLTAPGLIHSAAQYAVVLATAVTIGFNINPLMKYDGYFLLTDLLNVPNLNQQAQSHVYALLKRVLYGITVAHSAVSRRTRALLLTFGVLSALYRVGVVFGLFTLIAWKIPVVGLGLAVAFLLNSAAQSGHKLWAYLHTSEELGRARRRAIRVTLALAAVVPLAFLLFPIPNKVQAVGVVAQEDEYLVRAATPGFLQQAHAAEGELVTAGQPLFQLANIELETALATKQAELLKLESRVSAGVHHDLNQAIAAQSLQRRAHVEHEDLLTQTNGLLVKATAPGRVTQVFPRHQTGRFLLRGEPLARVGAGEWTVRATAAADVLIHAAPRVGDQLEIRLLGRPTATFHGVITRVAPAGSEQITDPAVTQLAGGRIAVNPTTFHAVEPHFEITFRLAEQQADLRPGLSAIINFSAGAQPLGVHFYRSALRFVNQLRASS